MCISPLVSSVSGGVFWQRLYQPADALVIVKEFDTGDPVIDNVEDGGVFGVGIPEDEVAVSRAVAATGSRLCVNGRAVISSAAATVIHL